MVGRARSERAHVVGGHVRIGMQHANVLGFEIEDLGDDLRHRGVGPLPHVDRAHAQARAAVGADSDQRHRCGRGDRRLEADGDTAAATQHAGAMVERRRPAHARGERVQHALDRRIPHRRAGRLRAAVPQDVAATELDRVDAELAGDQIGVALVGENELRDAEPAQRARRRPVGVELERIDADMLDVVRTGRREARFLRHPRADVGIGAAVPPDIAGARDDPAVIGHAAPDPERGRMLGDDVELLLHGEGDLDRPAGDQRQRRH